MSAGGNNGQHLVSARESLQCEPTQEGPAGWLAADSGVTMTLR